MGAAQGLIPAIDEIIENFNKRRLDLPDGLFDRKTQFIVNGSPFETLLGANPNDPLVLMLARGPAGYRFTAKALQHAIPDATVARGDVTVAGETAAFQLWLSGTPRGTTDAINALVSVNLRLTPDGVVQVVDATIDPAQLVSIRDARVRH
ncbi:MAG TPA: hypothetical protein VEC39_12860 [Vicinamibacterales bacterium]|nr:hypothetical protein [Vicinamibacterales bacterium]